MFSYEKLEIWTLAIQYAKEIYKLSSQFPKEELYGLVNQLRRAAVSISANIAEGSGSASLKEQINYLNIAIKSTLEVTSELELAFQLGYISEAKKLKLYENAEKIIRKIRAFQTFLRTKRSTIHA